MGKGGLKLSGKHGERVVVRAGIVNGETCDMLGLRECEVLLLDWSSQASPPPSTPAWRH